MWEDMANERAASHFRCEGRFIKPWSHRYHRGDTVNAVMALHYLMMGDEV